jgi:LysM repeat protein
VVTAICLASVTACSIVPREQAKVATLAPAVASAPTTTTAAPAPTPYVVARGDTLTAIAKRFGVSSSAIVAANHLTSEDMLTVGQVLRVPPVQPLQLNVTPANGPPGTSFLLHLLGVPSADTVTFSVAQPGHRPYTGPAHTPGLDGSVSATYETYPPDPAGAYVVLAHTSSGKAVFATFHVKAGTPAPAQAPPQAPTQAP